MARRPPPRIPRRRPRAASLRDGAPLPHWLSGPAAQLWHDPPSYYDGRFLQFETSWPSRLKQEGGFELIAVQLRQFEVAMRLAILLNRTLVLPRLRCGERTMAYPCYAWYHRAMAYFGLNFAKVPMPEVCPLYYWFASELAEKRGLNFREPNFLSNPRVSARISASVATARICQPRPGSAGTSGAHGSCGGGGGSVLGQRAVADAVDTAGDTEIALLANTTKRQLLRRLRVVEAQVLKVNHIGLLASALAGSREAGAASARRAHEALPWRPDAARAVGADNDLRELTANAWCTGCPITRRGAVVNDLNRSVVRDVEHFCRAEARGLLGLRSTQTCCSSGSAGCRICQPGERKTLANKTLSWNVERWLPVWAGLSYPADYPPPEQHWECRHPLCTGKDRQRFP